MKFYYLLLANLKSFFRNWTYIFLLMIFPLAVVCSVFFSVSSDGLRDIPIGFISEPGNEVMEEFTEASKDIFEITQFDELDDCINEMKSFEQYFCMEYKEEYSVLDVYLDNTRDLIVSDIKKELRSRVEDIQSRSSEKTIQEILDTFSEIGESVGTIRVNLVESKELINSFTNITEISITNLYNNSTGIYVLIDAIDTNIKELNTSKENYSRLGEMHYATNMQELLIMESYLSQLGTDSPLFFPLSESVLKLKAETENYGQKSGIFLFEIGSRVGVHTEMDILTKSYIESLYREIFIMNTSKEKLYEFQDKLSELDSDLYTMGEDVDEASDLNAGSLVTPFEFYDQDFYEFKDTDDEESFFDRLTENLNIQGLQLLFPRLLLLIVILLSLLISSFICLNEINSSYTLRVSLSENSNINEFISTYLTSLFLIIPPLVFVILLGLSIFKLEIPFYFTLLVLAILSTIFIMVSMSFSYLVRKESITLLGITFLLIFILYFSGYVLPIEVMAPWAKAIAGISPGKIAVDIFKETTFYSLTFDIIQFEFYSLLAWMVAMIPVAYYIKSKKNI